jgi:hypothetical protein
MLIEMYMHLKEAFPTHGLEVVFVSSDRDLHSYENYYASMPWWAIPFASIFHVKDTLAAIYGIQGIPSLVVLDAVSGNIVADASTARGEVIQACRFGETGIETLFKTWLSRVPSATQEMIHMLEISCVDTLMPCPAKSVGLIGSYLQRTLSDSSIAEDSDQQKHGWADTLFAEVRSANDVELVQSPAFQDLMTNGIGSAAMKAALETALAYLENAAKAPYNPKYRSFKLSNKIADRITQVKGGVQLIQAFGIDIVALDSDFYATILLGTNLDASMRQVQCMLERLEQI